VTDAASETVARLGGRVRDLAEINRKTLVELHTLHNRPEPVRPRPKRLEIKPARRRL
jgi:hypothetical protein